ncbi:MAG: hypothetical protein ABSG03_14220 [Bryobacteraceae bacterium]|jgi:hypothetical protein
MELFAKVFSSLLVFVYHCFDRIVIHGYLSGVSRPEQVVYFFHEVLGIPMVTKEALSCRTNAYRDWVESYARNHHIPIEWAEKGRRKQDYVLPALHRLEKKNAYGVYFIFKSMEQGRTFRISVPKFPTQDPNYRILAPSAQSVSRISISTSATRYWGRSSCAWPPSFHSKPPIG